jgi:hypothetical protein
MNATQEGELLKEPLQEGVCDEKEEEEKSCQYCGAKPKTDLCEMGVFITVSIEERPLYHLLSKELGTAYEYNEKCAIRCYHAWGGYRAQHFRGPSLFTDLILDRKIIPFGQPRKCRFCEAKVAHHQIRSHFDQEDLCGLRKTTLLGLCITRLHRLLYPPGAYYPVSYEELYPLQENVRDDSFPYQKAVEFLDNDLLKQKYKTEFYLFSSINPIPSKRKDLNPTNRVGYKNKKQQPQSPLYNYFP